MVSNKNAEVIIVGAGPSGVAASKVLSDAKVKTIILEKETTSSRNFYSGIVCSKPLGDIFPDFWKYAPIERKISKLKTYFLSTDSSTFLDNIPNENSYFNILRTPFLGSLMEKTNAKILRGEIVRNLIIEKHKVIGVETDSKKFYSDIVVIAEGAGSILTKKEGLRKGELLPNEIFLFVEESFLLLPEIIEKRFNLKPNEGIAMKFIIDSFKDVKSIGYLNTNKSSISLGTGILFSDSVSKKININDCHEKFKEHPLIRSFLEGGNSINFSSYILPSETPHQGVSTFENGCLVIGAAAGLVHPMDFDISSSCILSGQSAALKIIGVKK